MTTVAVSGIHQRTCVIRDGTESIGINVRKIVGAEHRTEWENQSPEVPAAKPVQPPRKIPGPAYP